MIPAGTKVYFAKDPADFRRGFDGLAALAASRLAKEPSDGGLFVFLNKRGDQVRILFRDVHGWCILAKRLDRGRFHRPRIQDGSASWETEVRTLMLFLDDIEPPRPRHKQRTSSSFVVPRLELVPSSHLRV